MEFFILDASFFLEGRDVASIYGSSRRFFISPLIFEEIRDRRTRNQVEMAIELGRMALVGPSTEGLKVIREFARETGDLSVLSAADLEVLAVAWDQKTGLGASPGGITIITDDFAIQNVAEHSGISYQAARKPRMRENITWVIYCPACRRSFLDLKVGSPCPSCDTPLKRKKKTSRKA